MNKLSSASDAIANLRDGMTIMIGGFLSHGTPEKLVDELVKSGVKDLTLIVNDTAFPDKGCGKLIVNRQIKKVITSHIGTNPHSEQQMSAGELEVVFCPQGTLIERIRAGGAGLGGVLSPTGIGTLVAEDKQLIEVDGKQYIFEKPLRADVALIKGSIGDRSGNLIYLGTTQNFNTTMATAADLVIAEVDTLKEVGEIEPERVHTPFIFVDYIVQ